MSQQNRTQDAGPPDGVGRLGEEVVVGRIIGMLPESATLIAGPGDDCAVVELSEGRWQLLKTDCLVEGVHFVPGTDPRQVGRKAMNRVISDIAAMGGEPRHALVTLAIDSGRSMEEIEGWYEGMISAAGEFGCEIAGGETSRLPCQGAVISIAMTGLVSPGECVFRSGASPGDVIAVTGRLGGSFESGRHLSFVPRLPEARWLVTHAKPTAMMDLSDGLGSDLPRLAKASGTGYRVDQTLIPCQVGVTREQAISDGEDYELLMTFAPGVFEALLQKWEEFFPETPLTKIGEITLETKEALATGWEHFRNE